MKREKTEKTECYKEELLALIDGQVSEEKRIFLEEHVETCAECKEYLEFIKEFSEKMKALPKHKEEKCPSSLLLAKFSTEKEEIDSETLANLEAHVLFCDDCYKLVLQLRRMDRP